MTSSTPSIDKDDDVVQHFESSPEMVSQNEGVSNHSNYQSLQPSSNAVRQSNYMRGTAVQPQPSSLMFN
jgi:hypothetical protein